MISFSDNNVYITDDGTFSLAKTFDCGQCFRFYPDGDGFSGVAFGRKLHAYNDGCGNVVLENVTPEEFESVWRGFFDLDRDYNVINEALSADTVAKRAVEAGRGIRILKQEHWETLCSFIISQNNNIPRIRKIIGLLCENFGDDIGGAYSFPAPERLLAAGVDGLACIRAGFRAKYIIDAAEKVVSGEIDLDAPAGMDYETARAYLMKIKGVGGKVADCALLFGYSFLSAFPKDVWIKRVIDKYYGESFDEAMFAPYGGIAQQYLFYYERGVGAKEPVAAE